MCVYLTNKRDMIWFKLQNVTNNLESAEPTRMEISYIFLHGIPLHPQFLDWRVWQVTNSENPLGISLLQSSRGVTWVAPEGTRKKWQAGHIDCWDCRYCSNPHPPNVNPARKAIILLHSNLILGRWDSQCANLQLLRQHGSIDTDHDWADSSAWTKPPRDNA